MNDEGIFQSHMNQTESVMKKTGTRAVLVRRAAWGFRAFAILPLALAFALVSGCGTGKETKKKDEFFTSGSREAD